jgi:tetratricopeptide (TPR) repeat protein
VEPKPKDNVVADLLTRGEILRESGDIDGAKALICTANSKSQSASDRITSLCQLALCYEHEGKLTCAAELYDAAYDIARDTAALDPANLARVLRHRASVALALGPQNVRLAQDLMSRSLHAALTCSPRMVDEVWIIHGMVEVAFALKLGKAEIRELLQQEREALQYAEHYHAQGPMRQKRLDVWRTGYLKDVAFSNLPWTLWALIPILFYVLRSGLALRRRQILRVVGLG